MAKIILITGGARSGKSAFAEKLARQAGPRVAYIATAEVGDGEMAERVALHRRRRPAEWETYEAPMQAENAIDVIVAAKQTELILFDCLTVYTSNAVLAQPEDAPVPLRRDAVLAAADRLLEAAGRFPGVVLFVTNEVGDGIVPDNALAREYRDLAGLVNQKAAQAATEVYWVVCGLPVEIKRQALAIMEGTV